LLSSLHRSFVLAGFAALLFAACGPSISTRAVAFSVDPEVNQRSPVPVELVVVYDNEVLPILLELTARQWFLSRQQLLLDHPRAIRSQLWELVPGQQLPMQRLPVPRDGAVAAFVYADYLTAGPHRVRVDPYARILLRLTPDELIVEPI
jgi:type VI secretion system protein